MSRFTETPFDLLNEIERLTRLNDALLDHGTRNAVIEECARLCEDRRWGIHTPLETIAAAIRALKD